MRLLLFLLFVSSTMFLPAQGYDRTCYFGFAFEISTNSRWGYGEPVITWVDPYSNAEKAGLKVGDIIMEVGGKATYLRHQELINSWIFDNTSRETTFTIRNLNNTFKEIRLSRYCRNVDAVTEDELADWYSLYSVEGNNKQHFSLPLHLEVYPEVDFSDYYTYDFIFKDKKSTEMDDYIVHQIERGLTAKGLIRVNDDPDILIQVYYSYEPNKNYTPSREVNGVMRFDVDLHRMVFAPVDSVRGAELGSDIKGVVNLGIQFFERKYISPGKMTRIWDAELHENITGDSFESYCQLHVPLMIDAYPYQTPRSRMDYSVDFREFNYTGISYRRNDLCTIDNVDENSPAYLAGVRAGDKVLSVNGIRFAPSESASKEAYADFVGETMAFRDISAGFFNDKVKEVSYPWFVESYGKIRKEFRKERYATGLSYLFAFQRYIDSKNSPELVFNVERRGYTFSFKVKPEKRKSATLVSIH